MLSSCSRIRARAVPAGTACQQENREKSGEHNAQPRGDDMCCFVILFDLIHGYSLLYYAQPYGLHSLPIISQSDLKCECLIFIFYVASRFPIRRVGFLFSSRFLETVARCLKGAERDAKNGVGGDERGGVFPVFEHQKIGSKKSIGRVRTTRVEQSGIFLLKNA